LPGIGVAMQICESFKRVTVAFTLASGPDQLKAVGKKVDFEFIYGIGVEGLCPFEMQLGGRRVGDTVASRLDRNKAMDYFGHLHPPIEVLLEKGEKLEVAATVRWIRAAQPHEIVGAMAAAVGGHGCDCGGG
jgi:hypothetical protein